MSLFSILYELIQRISILWIIIKISVENKIVVTKMITTIDISAFANNCEMLETLPKSLLDIASKTKIDIANAGFKKSVQLSNSAESMMLKISFLKYLIVFLPYVFF